MQTPDSTNPYTPPTSELNAPPLAISAGSIEDAIAGRYDFKIGEVLSEAWALTNGFKATFWGAAVVVGVIYLVVNTIVAMIVGLLVSGEGAWPVVAKQLVNVLTAALLSPLMLGLVMMAVRRAQRLPVSFSTAFGYLPKFGTTFVASLGVTLLSYLGFVLVVIPGIYLAVGYSMTTPLIGGHDLPAWRAMETSRKAVTHKWFRVFGLGIVAALIVLVSALGLLIPLIWTVPFAILTTGVLYRRMFGGAPAAPVVASPAPPTAS